MKFLFDLDGTVTSKETLPIIAEHFGVQDQIAELTHHTVQGNVPFVESFIRRVNILGRFSVSEISDLLARVLWGIERSGFFNGREKWAKGFENQRV